MSAKSLASRVGLGRKPKHVQLRYLYHQGLVTNKLLTLVKAHTSENTVDLFTKHLPDKTLQYLRAWVGLQGRRWSAWLRRGVPGLGTVTSRRRTSGSEMPPELIFICFQ
eukprot:3513728-Alexandrium_andersonii.AAC.1